MNEKRLYVTRVDDCDDRSGGNHRDHPHRPFWRAILMTIRQNYLAAIIEVAFVVVVFYAFVMAGAVLVGVSQW